MFEIISEYIFEVVAIILVAALGGDNLFSSFISFKDGDR